MAAIDPSFKKEIFSSHGIIIIGIASNLFRIGSARYRRFRQNAAAPVRGVVVAGRLKGLVHAGSEGREDVYVLAGSFETSQVRVGHRLCYADNSMSWWQKPVLITLEEERVVVRESSFTSGMN